MPLRIVLAFPKGDSCPVCGRQLIIIKWGPSYKEAICEKDLGHCGWWGYDERGSYKTP